MFQSIELDLARARMDPGRIVRAIQILDKGFEDKLYPGGVLWVERKGATALVHSVGYTDFEYTMPTDENTLYDLASLTKPVATASSILLACQDGLVHLDQPVADFLPERSVPHLGDVTLRHLLTHTSGLPPWKDMYSKGQTREQLIDELFSTKIRYKPGTHYAYSCLGYIMLSVIFEAITGEPLDTFARNRIFDPLGMFHTTFNPDSPAVFIAATDHCPMRRRKLVGEVHDGNAYALGGVSGNAGLFSTASDLAKFCRALLSGRFRPGRRVFSPAVVSLMLTPAIPEELGGQTIGWFTYPNEMMCAGDLASRRAVSHSGFTGTAIVIDPEYELFIILLTNRVCQEKEKTEFYNLRRRIFNAVIGSIVW
ncbi:MAG: beta-lactamase family protein [Armatimonadetes bacterium]|nr:beta-lactamase family protein [Armatimonadota bacterium]